ncbi:hypothetical protein [Longispora albida]|uniref:hypothetical protein n=1 Tax=Longispora albida TaxID=203523 RepID=UPI0012F94C68|nr:hypothetical protein [Longispora albida]
MRSASLVDADLWRASGGEPLRIARYRIRLESPISFLELDAIFGERGWSVTRRILSAGQTWAELHLAPAEWPLLLGALCQEPGTTCTHASLHTLVSDAVASGSATFADIASATGMSRDEVSRLAARRAAS